MKHELASIPSTDLVRIEGIVLGAKRLAAYWPNPTGNDPIKIDLEFRKSGNCHIFLVIGQWKEIDGEVTPVFEKE